MARASALAVLEKIEEQGAYSHIALSVELERAGLDSRDRGFATELVYGTLMWQSVLDAIIKRQTRRKLDPDVVRLLRLSLYQLVFLDRVPEHAILSEAMRLLDPNAPDYARGLVNGVLREATRKGNPALIESVYWEHERESKPVRYLSQRWSLPTWIANRMVQIYGAERAIELGEAYTQRPGQYLRAADGEALGEEATPVEGVEGCYRVERLSAPALQAALTEGKAQVQDLGSQLIVHYSGVKPGERVLDGCAGLGGKSLMLAQLVGEQGHVVAVEPLGQKLELLAQRADALGLSERLTSHAETLQEFAAVDSAERFDRVLLDAPCSGLGVMRRHPETKWRRQESHIPALVSLQRELLDVAAGLVKPGGELVYSVCTFLSEEGPKQIKTFLERHPEFSRVEEVDPSVPSRYVNEKGELALDPSSHDTDGFWAARLRRAEPA